MRTELDIVWDGTAPGLAEHELSVSALEKPLKLLLSAIRRVASNVIAGNSAGGTGGRYAGGAGDIDLRIQAVGHGCLDLSTSVVFPERGQLQLVDDDRSVEEETMKVLFEAIDAERRGISRSTHVQKFLRSLVGVERQQYTARHAGRIIGELSFGTTSLPPEPESHPFLAQYTGKIAGVIFGPKAEVRVQSAAGSIRLQATDTQIERALELRGEQVRIRAINSDGVLRLISLDIDSPPESLSVERARAHVLTRWSHTLERLAQ